MLIKNGLVLIDKDLVEADISFTDKLITDIGCLCGTPDFDARDCYVVPGFVDIHTHGAMGGDFSDGKKEAIQPMLDYYAAHGVTSVLGTTMTLQETVLLEAMQSMRYFQRIGGAKLAGIHLEGPFLSETKKGAQAAENLHIPDIQMFQRLQDASGGLIKEVTVACEEPGGLEFVREVSRQCTVSLGHTVADYQTAGKAYQIGASHLTHLFNGMPDFLHREPGVIGAALDHGATAELICDGLHVHPSVIRAAFKMFGDRIVLISDSLRCAGMPDGDYVLGGQPIEMKKGLAFLKGKETIAGSALSLIDGVRNVIKFGISPAAAFYAAATAPALAARLMDVGSLEIGKKADIVILDKELELQAVFIDGKRYL